MLAKKEPSEMSKFQRRIEAAIAACFEPEQKATPQNPDIKYDQWAETREDDRLRTGTLRELKGQLDRLRVPTEMQAAVLEQLVNAGMVTATFVNTEESS